MSRFLGQVQIGNPDDPTTKRAQALLSKTQAGQELWTRLEASPRAIFFHNINTHSKSTSSEGKNIANLIRDGNADGEIFSKTQYENAKKGKDTPLGVRGKFNHRTGHYDKTSDWDETHIVLLNNGVDAASISAVNTLAIVAGIDLSNDELADAIFLKFIGHESEHTVQDDFDLGDADYNGKTGQYTQDDRTTKKWGDLDTEKDAEKVSGRIVQQLFEKYYKAHPDVYSGHDDPGFRDVDPPAKQAIRVRA